jgi:hypothetical protein
MSKILSDATSINIADDRPLFINEILGARFMTDSEHVTLCCRVIERLEDGWIINVINGDWNFQVMSDMTAEKYGLDIYIVWRDCLPAELMCLELNSINILNFMENSFPK